MMYACKKHFQFGCFFFFYFFFFWLSLLFEHRIGLNRVEIQVSFHISCVRMLTTSLPTYRFLTDRFERVLFSFSRIPVACTATHSLPFQPLSVRSFRPQIDRTNFDDTHPPTSHFLLFLLDQFDLILYHFLFLFCFSVCTRTICITQRKTCTTTVNRSGKGRSRLPLSAFRTQESPPLKKSWGGT